MSKKTTRRARVAKKRATASAKSTSKASNTLKNTIIINSRPHNSPSKKGKVAEARGFRDALLIAALSNAAQPARIPMMPIDNSGWSAVSTSSSGATGASTTGSASGATAPSPVTVDLSGTVHGGTSMSGAGAVAETYSKPSGVGRRVRVAGLSAPRKKSTISRVGTPVATPVNPVNRVMVDTGTQPMSESIGVGTSDNKRVPPPKNLQCTEPGCIYKAASKGAITRHKNKSHPAVPSRTAPASPLLAFSRTGGIGKNNFPGRGIRLGR